MQDVEVKGSVRVALGLADSRVAILAIVGTRSINVEVAADPGTKLSFPWYQFLISRKASAHDFTENSRNILLLIFR